MAHKRPFDAEVVDEGSSKHQRQDGVSDEIGLYKDTIPLEDSSGKLYDIGESSIGKQELGSHEELKNSSSRVVRREDMVEGVESDVPSLSHWATSCTTDEDEPSEENIQLPFFPGYFSFDHSVRPVINPEDVYYCLLDYPPRKRIPVGPDHQADIPTWQPQVNGTTSDDIEISEPASSGINSGLIVGDVFGTCIVPNSETESLPGNGEKVGCGRTECMCTDQGSVRCVQLHIAEARDKLMKTLGRNTFMELGFEEMGEVVANKWTIEEEHLFHEIVYSNSVSLGKNFWNVLSAVFSSRTKMEIVSYYFNVFMLRKRAVQNRCDPLNVDSDDDEWYGGHDDGADEGGVSDEDEDSGVESPVRHNVPEFYQNGLHLHEDEHEFEDDPNLSEEAQDYNGNSSDVGVQKSGVDCAFEATGKKGDDDAENDVQDGSCTSSDSGDAVQGPRLKSDGCQVWNEYMIDSSDAKVWDGFSLSCPKQSVEFLPTCSMIEEVFGDGDIDSKSKRW